MIVDFVPSYFNQTSVLYRAGFLTGTTKHIQQGLLDISNIGFFGRDLVLKSSNGFEMELVCNSAPRSERAR